jgi:hypothetical protein
MSYNLSLQCGCVVYVACHPDTGLPHTRVIETRASACPVRRHEVGLRLALWELLPDRSNRPRLNVFVVNGERLARA